MNNPSISAALQEASESVSLDFQSWPKIPRLSKESMVITEKIDGTNGQILITEDGTIKAGSRNRWVTPEDDNYGFAKWVMENQEALRELGPGRHFGEWWGQGIQRGYGLTEKRFSLFNTHRELSPSLEGLVSKVPLMYMGKFDSNVINSSCGFLTGQGSIAAPGFMKPEGIVVYYSMTRSRHKVILENDNEHKWKQAQVLSVVAGE